MSLYLVHSEPGFWIVIQHPLNEVLVEVTWLLVELRPELVGLFPKHFVEVKSGERILPHDQHEEYNTE